MNIDNKIFFINQGDIVAGCVVVPLKNNDRISVKLINISKNKIVDFNYNGKLLDVNNDFLNYLIEKEKKLSLIKYNNDDLVTYIYKLKNKPNIIGIVCLPSYIEIKN
ncbi:MAG: hypothetical protein WDA06_05615 [Phenylobacterium sp.]